MLRRSPRLMDIGCVLLGTLAMALGAARFVHIMHVAASSSPHRVLILIAWLAFWALLFEAGALLLGRGIRGLRPLALITFLARSII